MNEMNAGKRTGTRPGRGRGCRAPQPPVGGGAGTREGTGGDGASRAPGPLRFLISQLGRASRTLHAGHGERWSTSATKRCCWSCRERPGPVTIAAPTAGTQVRRLGRAAPLGSRPRFRADSGRDGDRPPPRAVAPSGRCSSRSAAVSVRGPAAPLAPCPAGRLRDAALWERRRSRGPQQGEGNDLSTRRFPGLFVDSA